MGGLASLMVGLLTGIWVTVDMIKNEGKLSSRYIMVTHKAALWFGFMNPGLAYLANYMNLTENTLIIVAWATNAGIALTVLAHGLRGARGLTNTWVNPGPVELSMNVLGDIDSLIGLLQDDIALYTDGGGKVNAAINIVRSKKQVADWIMGVAGKPANRHIAPAYIYLNGMPGIAYMDGKKLTGVVTIDIDKNGVKAIRMVLNPEKLPDIKFSFIDKVKNIIFLIGVLLKRNRKHRLCSQPCKPCKIQSVLLMGNQRKLFFSQIRYF